MSGGPAVFAPPHDSSNRALDRRPLVHDLVISHTQNYVSSLYQCEIPTAILRVGRKARVPRLAVQLDYETVSDDEVDTPDSVDSNLGPIGNVQRTKPEPGLRLESGLRRRVDELEVGAVFRRKRLEDLTHIEHADEAIVQSRVQCDYDLLARLAQYEVTKRRRYSVDSNVELPRRKNRRSSMQAHTVSSRICKVNRSVVRRAQMTRVPSHGHVQHAVVDAPNTFAPEGGHAREVSTDSHGRHKRGIGVPSRDPTAPRD